MKTSKAFTLIELLIVIVIIGILAVALIPRLTGAQARARDTARKADINTLRSAIIAYTADNNGKVPPSAGPVCIGAPNGQKCRPGYQQNLPGNGGNGSTGVQAFGSDSFSVLMRQYLTSLPNDPSPTRMIGGNYIYISNGSMDLRCNTPDVYTEYNITALVRQPDTLSTTTPATDEQCSPGKRACCSRLGCGSHRFCLLQIED